MLCCQGITWYSKQDSPVWWPLLLCMQSGGPAIWATLHWDIAQLKCAAIAVITNTKCTSTQLHMVEIDLNLRYVNTVKGKWDTLECGL
jgi:hypothetical protein